MNVRAISLNLLVLIAACAVIFIVYEKRPAEQRSNPITFDDGTQAKRIDGCFEIKSGKIYCGGSKTPLPDVDPKTFVVVDYLIGKDSKHVYDKEPFKTA